MLMFFFFLQVLWDLFLASSVIGCAASTRLVAVTCTDATLHCFSAADGSRLLPGLKLDGPAVMLRLQEHFLAVVTALGVIHVWDMTNRKSTLKTSIMNLIEADGTVSVSSCTIRETGCPVVGFSNGKTYTYSSDLDTWLLLSDALDPLRHGSDLQGINAKEGPKSGAEGRKGVINNADLKITCSISYADARMSALAELNSPGEYRTWLMTKIKYMAQQGNANKRMTSNRRSLKC